MRTETRNLETSFFWPKYSYCSFSTRFINKNKRSLFSAHFNMIQQIVYYQL